MIRYVTVPGTHGAGKTDWDALDSPFSQLLAKYGCVPLIDNPLQRFMWSTTLDGVDSSHTTWDASGRALAGYFTPPLLGKPVINSEDIFIVSHSHGGNVVAYACGKYGLKVNGLITVGMPIREDMHDMYEMAAPNIERHLHLYGGWQDYWQCLGALFDGRFGIHREHPFAKNDRTPGGHGAVLREHKYFNLWSKRGWLNYWMGLREANSGNSAGKS